MYIFKYWTSYSFSENFSSAQTLESTFNKCWRKAFDNYRDRSIHWTMTPLPFTIDQSVYRPLQLPIARKVSANLCRFHSILHISTHWKTTRSKESISEYAALCRWHAETNTKIQPALPLKPPTDTEASHWHWSLATDLEASHRYWSLPLTLKPCHWHCSLPQTLKPPSDTEALPLTVKPPTDTEASHWHWGVATDTEALPLTLKPCHWHWSLATDNEASPLTLKPRH